MEDRERIRMVLTRADGSLQETLRVGMVRRDIVQGNLEVDREHRHICLDKVKPRTLDQALHAFFLDGKGDSDHLDVGVDLQCLTNKAAGCKAEGEHTRSLAREVEDAGGLLHLVADTVHHAEEDFGRTGLLCVNHLVRVLY